MFVCIRPELNWIWDERDVWFGEIEIRVGRYCLGIEYMLYKERESGEMRMRMRIRMKVVDEGGGCLL